MLRHSGHLKTVLPVNFPTLHITVHWHQGVLYKSATQGLAEISHQYWCVRVAKVHGITLTGWMSVVVTRQ